MSNTKIYTSESVSSGHPDKVADQISDAILDACLAQDKNCRSAVETLVTKGLAFITGELTCKGYVDINKIARDTIIDIGYNRPELGFDGHDCGIIVSIQEQSPDIAAGVDTGGAGDQGIMYGYATRETPDLMPLPISISHELMRQADKVRKEDPKLGFRPDAKGQVSIIYENGEAKEIETTVLAIQHEPEYSQDRIRENVKKYIIQPVMDKYSCFYDPKMKIHINPSGIFVQGGPQADAGLTGRKIIVDTYGGLCPHGGGAFSGKDPTKVDRSATYMARHLAKCIVAADLADRAQVALAYALGVVQPVALNLETFGTEHLDPEKIEKKIRDNFDLSPKGIATHLKLKETKYRPTAAYGHFGGKEYPWEDTKPADALRN